MVQIFRLPLRSPTEALMVVAPHTSAQESGSVTQNDWLGTTCQSRGGGAESCAVAWAQLDFFAACCNGTL